MNFKNSNRSLKTNPPTTTLFFLKEKKKENTKQPLTHPLRVFF